MIYLQEFGKLIKCNCAAPSPEIAPPTAPTPEPIGPKNEPNNKPLTAPTPA